MRITQVIERLGRRAWRWFLSEQSGSRPQDLIAWTALLVIAALVVSSGLLTWIAGVALSLAGWLVDLVASTPAAIAIVAAIAALRLALRRRRAAADAPRRESRGAHPLHLSEQVPVDPGPSPPADSYGVPVAGPGEGADRPAAAPDASEESAQPDADRDGLAAEPQTGSPDSAYRRALAEARAEAEQLDAAP